MGARFDSAHGFASGVACSVDIRTLRVIGVSGLGTATLGVRGRRFEVMEVPSFRRSALAGHGRVFFRSILRSEDVANRKERAVASHIVNHLDKDPAGSLRPGGRR